MLKQEKIISLSNKIRNSLILPPRLQKKKELPWAHETHRNKALLAAHHQKTGKEVLTITPEFGPATFMMHHPLTREPLADQWMIDVWMMEYLKKELK